MTRGRLFITFGVQYGDAVDALAAAEAGRSMPDPHPTADWATGKGYLTVDYGLPNTAEDNPDEALQARERARAAAYAWLGGEYAFEYSEAPTADYAPRGEVARLVLP